MCVCALWRAQGYVLRARPSHHQDCLQILRGTLRAVKPGSFLCAEGADSAHSAQRPKHAARQLAVLGQACVLCRWAQVHTGLFAEI